MKPTQVTELLANIKATFVSFFSIMMFVALGVGIYTGINWTGPALETKAQAAFDEGKLHNFQIQFPYGLSDDDIKQLEAIEGVDEVETIRTSFQKIDNGDGGTFVVKLLSTPTSIDALSLVEGKLPDKPGEIVVHEKSANTLGVTVGDTIAFNSDISEQNANTSQQNPEKVDADGMTYLNLNEFTVCGIANSAEYLALSTETYGYSTTSSGSVNAIAWVQQEAFDDQAFYHGWPIVNVRSAALDNVNSFSPEYDSTSVDIAGAIDDLGRKLGDARFRDIHDSAQSKIDEGDSQLATARIQISDGQKQLRDAKEQIASGEKQIADGEAQLEDAKKKVADGEEQLAAGQEEYDQKTAEAKEKLNGARVQIENAQAQYEDAVEKLDVAKQLDQVLKESYPLLKEAAAKLGALRKTLVDNMARLGQSLDAGQITPEEYWQGVMVDYRPYKAGRNETNAIITTFNVALDQAKARYPGLEIEGSLPELAPLPDFPDTLGDNDVTVLRRQLEEATAESELSLEALKGADIWIAGTPISINTAGEQINVLDNKINEAEQALATKKDELDKGIAEYNKAVSTYDTEVENGKKKLEDAQVQLESGKEQVAKGESELEAARAKIADGKAQLSEKADLLEEAKTNLAESEKELDDAKRKLGLMKKYGWTVAPRSYNGGAIEVDTFAGVTNRLSLSMAALFVIVGLLVSYSAVGRTVHEQITQIGTKKALGFRSREITLSFILYATLAVVAGAILGLVVGVYVVEGIIARALVSRFTFDSIPPYFDIATALVVTGIELVLVLLATWLACYSILRKHAVDLLRGEEPPAGKERFFEKWAVWDKLPLFSQTIINNCLNDKRRVFSTIVGVAGCTALVVTALTLNDNVLASYDKHYQSIYGFDTIVYAEDGVEGAIDNVVEALESKGYDNAAVLYKKQSIQLESGDRAASLLVVPEDEERFNRLYHVHSPAGTKAVLSDGGAWLSQAFEAHTDAAIGQTVTINASDGGVHTIDIEGFQEFFLTYYEMVVGRTAYEEHFATNLAPNAVLVNRGGSSIDDVRHVLASVHGFDQAIDDKTKQHKNFEDFSSVSRTVVLVYLALSALMAIVVLLNLNVMFIDEKKRELIVLMINGYSTKHAKRYIYQDTIVLTAIGVIVGLVLGAVMGATTVAAIEPDSAWFFKGADPIALLAGAGVSIVLATIMSIVALRRIPKFNLSDINRF